MRAGHTLELLRRNGDDIKHNGSPRDNIGPMKWDMQPVSDDVT